MIGHIFHVFIEAINGKYGLRLRWWTHSLAGIATVLALPLVVVVWLALKLIGV